MRRCPECGTNMTHHEWGHKIYYICPGCGNEFVTPKSAEALLGPVG